MLDWLASGLARKERELELAAVAAGGVLVHIGVLALILPSPGCDWLACDFMADYLPTSRSILASGVPGPGFLYPPLFALLISPLGLLSDATARVAWTALQMVMVGGLVALGARWFSGRRYWLYAGLVGTSVAVVSHTVWGQLAIPLTILVFAGAPWTLGLAVALKYYPVLFLTWWVVRRDWPFLLKSAAWTAAFTLVPILAVGPDAFAQWFTQTAGQIGTMGERSSHISIAQGWPYVLGRLQGYGLPTGGFALWSFLWACLVGAGAWAIFWYAKQGRQLETFVVVATLYPLLPLIVWPNYFVALPLVWMLLLGRHGWSRAVAVLSIALGCAAIPLTWTEGAHAALGMPFFANVSGLVGLIVPTLPKRRAEVGTQNAGADATGAR